MTVADPFIVLVLYYKKPLGVTIYQYMFKEIIFTFPFIACHIFNFSITSLAFLTLLKTHVTVLGKL